MKRRRKLGELIGDDVRVAPGCTQDRFSEAIGLSRAHIQRIESGQADPRLGDLLRMSDVLDGPLTTRVGTNPTPR
ncbi:helix-turn-helix domain-containing protein [Streptomyces cupreus]|uniref:Helix-turn-helix transcriptional regulator n=1 Tax=Streptomyces cupreus TaxID=2759956 RepID=A0A7X1M779_9ACTN|nr:helix-turn-helix transcriptional regulator [Streptomyces cupreus]MBC2900233.1 helix-turn-helix transcriptional regulator [Streptomyces cupreus]